MKCRIRQIAAAKMGAGVDLAFPWRVCQILSMGKLRHILPVLLALGFLIPITSAAPHTPKPGSPERRAICDAMRAYVVKDQSRPLPKLIVFKIEFLRVEEDFAGFEGFPVFEDGSDAIPDYLPDIVYTTLLRRDGEGWKIIADLSRTDVPSEMEMSAIRKSVPAEVPGAVLPEFWREKLRR